MEAFYVISLIAIYILGIATGLYFSSQVEEHINNNIKGNKRNGKK